MSNKTEFTQVTTNLNGTRDSALYRTIETLIANKATCIRSLTITKSQNLEHPAYYIKMSNSPKHNPFHSRGYEWQDAHLTIEKYFKENAAGLSMAHYTERYINHHTKKSLIVHTYFNRHAVCAYNEVKEYDGIHYEGSFIKLSENNYVENLLTENALPATELLKKILSENEIFYRKAYDTANTYEQQLRTISLRLQQSDISDYLKIAEKFIETIRLLNQYSDTVIDKRDKLMEQQISYLKTMSQSSSTETLESSSPINEARPKEKTDNTSTVPKKPNQLYQHILKLKEQFDANQKNLKSKKNVDLILKQDELIKEIERNILCISSETSSLKPKEKSRLEQILKSIEQRENLQTIFETELLQGNLIAVQKIFPIIQHQCNSKFILYNMLIPLIKEHNPQNGEQENKLEAMLDFINQTSKTYQLLVGGIMGAPLVFFDNEETEAGSLLLVALYSDNFFMFKKLLQHGADPNGIAIKNNKDLYPILFAYVISQNKDTKYLQLLIDCGARIEIKPVTSGKSLNLDNLEQETKKIKSMTSVVEPVNQIVPIIDYAASTNQFKTLEMLAPQLPFIDLIKLIARLSLLQPAYKKVVTNKNVSGLAVALDEASADNFIQQVNSEVTTNFYLVMIYTQKLQDDFYNLFKTLITRQYKSYCSLKENNPESLDLIYQQLLEAGNIYAKVPAMWLDAEIHFTSCIYMLAVQLGDNPKNIFMMQQKIIQLYAKLAGVFEKQPSAEIQGKLIAKNYLKNAIQIADSSKYSKELKETPIYQFCSNKLISFETTANDSEKNNSLALNPSS